MSTVKDDAGKQTSAQASPTASATTDAENPSVDAGNAKAQDASEEASQATPRLQAISRQISEFVRLGLEGKSPDIDSAKQIMNNLVSILTPTEPQFSNELESTVSELAETLRPDAHKWNDALKLLATCFSGAESSSEHPKADKSFVQKGADGSNIYRIDLELVDALTVQIFKQGKKEELIAFIRNLADFDLVRSLARCVPKLKLDLETFVAILHCADRLTKGDMIRAEVLQPLGQWICANPDTAKQIIDDWLAKRGSSQELSHDAIFFVVVELVQSVGSELMNWRNKLLDTISQSDDLISRSLAVFLACFAWPAGTPATTRHAEMLHHVKRSPEQLVEVGLRVMSTDARKAPQESVETGLVLLAMLNGRAIVTPRKSPILMFAEIVQSVAYARKSMSPLLPIELLRKVLDTLLHAPLTQEHIPLDSFLAELLKTEPALAQDFLGQWIIKHKVELQRRGDSLKEIFPLLSPSLLNKWLISFVVHPDPNLRSAAAQLWDGEARVTLDYLKDLSAVELQALVHQLAGSLSSSLFVPLIVEIGALRPECLPTVTQILVADGIGDCSATCSDSVERCWKASTLPAIQSAYQLIREKLEEHRTTWEQRLKIPELRTSWHSHGLFAELFNRQMHQTMQEYRDSGRALFTKIATTVNLIYGAKSVSPYNPDQKIELKAYTSKLYEQPILEVIDSIGEIRKREQHLEQAAKMLAERGR
ncbi:MAG: hypothetical protein U1A78_26000 [Polyangia bacterium]